MTEAFESHRLERHPNPYEREREGKKERERERERESERENALLFNTCIFNFIFEIIHI